MKMNNRLVWLVIILAVTVVFETGFLWSMYAAQDEGLKGYAYQSRTPDSTRLRAWNVWHSPSDDSSRTLTEWEPLREMEGIQERVNEMFRESLEKGARARGTSSEERKSFFAPHTDIKETDGGYIIQMDVPGLRREDITITLQAGVLTIFGERKSDATEGEKGGVVTQEREFGYFSRSIPLPQDVTQAEITAACDSGVLSIALPRDAAAREKDTQVVKISVDEREKLKAAQ